MLRGEPPENPKHFSLKHDVLAVVLARWYAEHEGAVKAKREIRRWLLVGGLATLVIGLFLGWIIWQRAEEAFRAKAREIDLTNRYALHAPGNFRLSFCTHLGQSRCHSATRRFPGVDHRRRQENTHQHPRGSAPDPVACAMVWRPLSRRGRRSRRGPHRHAHSGPEGAARSDISAQWRRRRGAEAKELPTAFPRGCKRTHRFAPPRGLSPVPEPVRRWSTAARFSGTSKMSGKYAMSGIACLRVSHRMGPAQSLSADGFKYPRPNATT